MAKLDNYNGSVQLIAGITQKGGGDFALIDANAIQTREDDTRLDAELTELRDLANVQSNWAQADEESVDFIKNKPNIGSGISENSIQAQNNNAGVKGYRIKGFYNHHLSLEGAADGSVPGEKKDWYYISFSDDATPSYPLYLKSLEQLGSDYGYGETPPVEFRGVKVNWVAGNHLTLMNANNWDDACVIVAEYGDDEGGYYYEIDQLPFYGLWVQHDVEGTTTTTDDVYGTTIEEFNDAINSFENKVELHDLSYCAFNINQPSVGIVDGGMNAFAQGEDAVALLQGSAAFGLNNKSIGKYSFTTGRNNTAYYGSFASGRGNYAGADISGAVGQNNVINRSSRNSFVEGVRNELYGYAEHGEGQGNIAYGSFVHVEGQNNIVGRLDLVGKDENTNSAHVEGYGNKALSHQANIHIEGRNNESYGAGSHTEGRGNVNKSHYSHIEGQNNTADTGYNNADANGLIHLEGYHNTSGAPQSHIEGADNETTSTQKNIHIEGKANKAGGGGSHTEGHNNTNNAHYAHVEGHNNTANQIGAENMYGHIEGNNNVLNGRYGHIEGQENHIGDVNGGPQLVHIEGKGNKVFGSEGYIHAEGRNNTVTKACAAHVEGDANTIESDAHWSHAGGKSNVVSHEGAFAHGKGLKTGAQYQTVVGQYNEGKSDTIFEVGSGTESSRKNAFEVLSDGTIRIGDNIFDGTSSGGLTYVSGMIPGSNCVHIGSWSHNDRNSLSVSSTVMLSLHHGNGFDVDQVGIYNIAFDVYFNINSEYGFEEFNIDRASAKLIAGNKLNLFLLKDVDNRCVDVYLAPMNYNKVCCTILHSTNHITWEIQYSDITYEEYNNSLQQDERFFRANEELAFDITTDELNVLNNLANHNKIVGQFAVENGTNTFRVEPSNVYYSRNYKKDNYKEERGTGVHTYAHNFAESHDVIPNKSLIDLMAEEHIIRFPVSIDSARFESFTYNANWAQMTDNTLTKMLSRFISQLNSSLGDSAFFTDTPKVVQFFAYANSYYNNASVRITKGSSKTQDAIKAYDSNNHTKVVFFNSTYIKASSRYESTAVDAVYPAWEIGFTDGCANYKMVIRCEGYVYDMFVSLIDGARYTIDIYKEEKDSTKLTVGNTTLDEAQLIKILRYMETVKLPSEGLAFVSNGDGTCYVSGRGNCTDADVVIPSESPDGDIVTKIGDHAFSNDQQLTSIVIPDTVKVLDRYAIADCYMLQSYSLPEGLTTIGDSALSYAPVSKINIPRTVTSIGDVACKENACTNIFVPNNVTSWGVGVFEYCSVKTATFENGITVIPYGIFRGCTSLTDVNIPVTVTSIEEQVFDICRSLTNINYAGTKTQWNAITKANGWDSGTNNYTVHCTDGDIAKA